VFAFAAPPLTVALVLAAPPRLRLAAGLYGAGLTALLVVSAAYHRGHWTPRQRRRMKAIDHTTIFLFIATSWTPLGLLLLSPSAARLFLGTLWAGCAAGSVVKLRSLQRLGGPADVWYAMLGWWGLLITPVLVSGLGSADLALLASGLLLYGAGSAALTTRRPDPLPTVFGYHEVAHAVGLVGIACHVTMYLRLFGP
jgi:hemolysin III